MIEIRIHGRGGQGVRKASQILARAAYIANYQTQDFALYGAERAGAPITSFVRIDKKNINTRGYIFEPDYIIILDETLDLKETLKGKKPSTKILINSPHKIKNQCTVDATGISIQEIGRPLGANVALLGAFCSISKLISLKNLEEAIKIELKKYPKEILEKNIKASKKCYETVKC